MRIIILSPIGLHVWKRYEIKPSTVLVQTVRITRSIILRTSIPLMLIFHFVSYSYEPGTSIYVELFEFAGLHG